MKRLMLSVLIAAGIFIFMCWNSLGDNELGVIKIKCKNGTTVKISNCQEFYTCRPEPGLNEATTAFFGEWSLCDKNHGSYSQLCDTLNTNTVTMGNGGIISHAFSGKPAVWVLHLIKEDRQSITRNCREHKCIYNIEIEKNGTTISGKLLLFISYNNMSINEVDAKPWGVVIHNRTDKFWEIEVIN